MFTDICREVEHDDFEDIKAVEVCCQFLSDIGAILWYRDMNELRDWVILEPAWAMNAVYKLIDDENVKKSGFIRKEDFENLWNDDAYKEKHGILKKMLEKFKIAFPTKPSKGEDYILPARLLSIPHEKKWKLEKDALQLEYKFGFMPKGIINQLSAELSRNIYNNEVWNNAVNLVYEDSISQVFEDFYNRTLTITSKGKDARGINMLIMNALKDIIDSYRGVKEEIHVKCPCKKCQSSEKPSLIPYEDLVEFSKEGRDRYFCNKGNEDLSISKLLYNVGFGEKGIQQKIKQISIFLASSEELKDDRKEFEIFINRENNRYIEKGIFFKLEVWEDFIDRISETRLQDEYNKAVINSDIFISLFWTKTGKYTKEEFGEAYNHFKKTGKPSIYTYFKTAPVNPQTHNTDSMFQFRKELEELGHFPTSYENIGDLKYQFKMQLEKLMPLRP